ncbi:prepilin-type N-terminal cleavage/methylation domain-containing protein, partial [Jatrophihabitans sp.]|uniref:prepilin-type N-terminal cleavage/methylation domain-containing protein n=1 Tax=Jatrophihabitans sp. TaxID=1932789 RepID=UPI0030C6EE4A|nr:hypothetical protein [Jatrophihabitans sp.]
MLKLSHHLRGGRCTTCRRADDQGFTLVELLVAVLILAIIIVPISAAMIAGFKVVDLTGSSLQSSINRDQASARWAADVAAVDATGVSYSTARACRGNGGGSNETLYVTFNTSRLDNAGSTQVRRVSYWVTGSGTGTSFVRRSCAGTLNSLSLTNAHEFVVARNMGVKGRSQADTVFAPNGAGTKPCNEFSCEANMNGRYYFELRAQRRTFGAGVPLQVGRLYSSAYTRALGSGTSGNNDRFRYAHVSLAGTVGSLEPAMGNTVGAQRLSLAPGLEGSPGMNVQFRVQQKTTGKWLTSVAGSYKFDGTNAAAWVTGSYDSATETWYVPMAFGTEAQVGATTGALPTVDAGGEYRVYTQLTESGATAVPKQYGGANGFPLWIDWRPDAVVFVNGTSGVDTNDGRVDATGIPKPVKTLARALAVAKDNPSTPAANDDQRPEILINSYVSTVATSGFTGQLRVDATTAINNLTLQGANTDKWLRAGVDNATWGRSRLTGGPSTTASPPTEPSIGLSMSGVTGMRIRQLNINSGTTAATITPRALSTYGIMISNSATPSGTQLELQNLDVGAATA